MGGLIRQGNSNKSWHLDAGVPRYVKPLDRAGESKRSPDQHHERYAQHVAEFLLHDRRQIEAIDRLRVDRLYRDMTHASQRLPASR
jgi:hypothetical protein